MLAVRSESPPSWVCSHCELSSPRQHNANAVAAPRGNSALTMFFCSRSDGCGPVEDRLGLARYLLLYLACGVIAALTHYQFNPTSPVPALGASGAIAGVIGCYVRLLPFSRVIVVVPILFFPFFFDAPAIVFVGIWFLMQLTQGMGELLTPETGAGIAWWAHVGGFLAGLFLGSLLVLPKREHRPYYADEGLLGFDPMGRP
jgi:membrane associated rhomboid family serine protease